MAAPTFTSLIPAAGPVEAEPLIGALELRAAGGAAGAKLERPYTIVNFVSSVDGRAAVDGRSRALGDAGDRAIFHALRERVDAVIVGASTISAERYGRIIPDSERRARRVAAGRSAEPLAVTISRTGTIPADIPLFAEPEARVVVFAGATPALDGVAADVRVEPLANGDAGLPAALATLHRDYGIESLLCEGGPRLFAALLHAGLVDELFLTLSPQLAGGDSGPSITSGPPLPELAQLTIRALLQRGNSLYLRYAVTD
jgi:riboflavin-specific deaminase-like protein